MNQKIHILWCTLRTQQFKEMHSEWIKRADNPTNIQTYVAVNWEPHALELKDYLKNNFLVTLNTNKIGVCYPSYQLSSNLGVKMGKCKDSDIVIFVSDDFMAPQGWDTYLIDKLKDKGDTALMVRDGYQLPDSSNMLHPAITIPIMTYGCLNKLNMTIYHPAYNHMFSDCELYNNLKDLNLLYDDRLNDETMFEHLHYAGKRVSDQADQAYNSKWSEDELTWNKRKLMTVEERLKI
jgi:hypothetical protein